MTANPGEEWVQIGDRLERRIDQDWRRKYQAPEEMLRRIRGVQWDGQRYRKFISPNVVCIEHYRRIVDVAKPSAA